MNGTELVRQELTPQAQRNAEALAKLADFAIASDEDLSFAGEMIQAVKAQWKALEERRTAVTKPMNEALRQVNALFKPATGPLVQAEIVLKEKIAQYTLARRAQVALDMVSVAQGTLGVSALAPVPTPAGVTVRERWAYEVTDVEVVPRRFLSVDDAKVKTHMDFADTDTPPCPVAGLRFFKAGSVVVRT